MFRSCVGLSACAGLLAAVSTALAGAPQCVVPPPDLGARGLRAGSALAARGGGPGLAPPATTGPIRMLVVLAEFADVPHGIEAARFADHLFGPGPSLKSYFADASGGRLLVDGDIRGWFTLPRTQLYYSSGAGGIGAYPNNGQRMAEDAVAAAVAAGTDLRSWDADGDGVVDALLVIHSGEAYEWAGSTNPALSPFPDPNTVNSHKWSVMNGNFGAGMPRVADYFTCAELQRANPAFFPGWTDSLATLGVVCHEFGHVLGLPDLYDVQTIESRVGSWDLMDAGTWTRVASDPARSLPGAVPARLSAWPRMFLGWTAPIAVAPAAGDVAETSLLLESASAGAAPVQLRANPFGVDWTPSAPGRGEYFLAELRTREGWDEGLPAEGLLVYHVDEARRGNRASDYADGAGLLLLAPQDGDLRPSGEAGDPWPGAQSAFGASTNPSSNLHAGTASGVELSRIGPPAAGRLSLVATVSNLEADVAPPFARPHPFRPARHGEVALVLSLAAAPEPTRVRVFDLRGRRVRTLQDAGDFTGAGRVARWDGRDDAGDLLPSGVYWFRTDRGAAGRVVLLRE